MSSPEDERLAAALMAEIARGHEPALARLVERYGRGIRSFSGRFLGSAAEAEEVAQDVFVTCWRKAASFDPGRGTVAAWLYRIARNACIDRQRRRRLRWLVGLDTLEPAADEAPDALRHVAGRDALAQVRAEIAALPDRQRMALLLAAVGGMDTTEIAGIMKASRGSVEQLLVRARRHLRARLPDLDPATLGGPGHG